MTTSRTRRFDFDKFVRGCEAGGYPVILGWSSQEKIWCIALPNAGEIIVGRGLKPVDAAQDVIDKLNAIQKEGTV
ncbi:hypothetical protein [Armatimonas sp.]|uniref:hypothetical protein n=1 Tax=Armatimonas sp. TaxID=1872638 RepID=UPI00374DA3AD